MTTHTRFRPAYGPASLALAVAVAFSALFATGSSCDRNDDKGPPATYSPDQETWEATRSLYTEAPVVETAAALTAIGHGGNVTDLPLAVQAARDDAANLAVRKAVISSIYMRDEKAGEYFGTHPAMVERAVRDRFLTPGEPTYREEQLGYGSSRYDLYQTFILPTAAMHELVAELVDEFQRTRLAPTAQNIEFPVVLTNLQRSLSYEQKVKMVANAIQAVVDELGYKGTVVPLEQVHRQSPEQLADLKRSLVTQIPPGSDVEVSFTFEFQSRDRLKAIAFYDTRGRKLPPIAISQHPAPVGGRYQYSVAIPSFYVKKGTEKLPVEITTLDGRTYQTDYPLGAKFQYTDNNIGLLMIRDFVGHLQNLASRLRDSIRLPDDQGDRTVTIMLDTDLRLMGRSSAGAGVSDLTFSFRIGLFRPNATTVWYLKDNAPNPALLSDPQQANALPWEVIWRERDPDGRYGDLENILVPGNESRQLYVKIEYNGGRDFDILLFDFRNRDLNSRLTEPRIMFTTRGGS